MMGKDCERMLSEINGIKDALISAIKGVSSSINYRIKTKGSHGEHGIELIGYEEPNGSVAQYVSSVKSAYSSFSSDNSKMKSLESNMYTSSNSLNNSYGSPWKELHVLEESINNISSFNSGSGQYIGGKIELLGLLNIALSCAIDAKWALITYHDYIQRGFDTKFNDNEPSITFKKANKKDSIGNINQDFKENVNVKQPSIDPY